MCNGRMGGVAQLCASLLLLAAAHPLRAQTQAEYRDRVRELVPIWQSVTAAARRADSLQARALPPDTVRVGVLTILADTGLRDLADRSAAQAVRALRERFGSSTDDLTQHLFTLRRSKPPTPDHPMVDLGEVGGSGKMVRLNQTPPTVEAIGGSWAMRGSQVLTDQLGSAFGRWLGNAIPVEPADATLWVGVRIDLVTSPFQTSRECYDGDIDACERALGISDTPDPFLDWFNASERREIIYRDRYQIRRAQPGEFGQCLAHNDDSACLALGALIPPNQLAPPLGPSSRQSVARLAMSIGGPTSFSRMRSASRGVNAQLRAASGISTDSLVRRWRAAVLTAEAQHTTMTPGLAFMSLFWVTTCGAFALGSSRWR